MECHQVNTHIDDWLDETLAEPLRSAVQLHLHHCPACRQVAEQGQSLRSMLRDLPVPPPTPGFHERVLRYATVSRTAGARNALVGLALAATLVIGVGVGLMIAPSAPVPTAGMQSVALTLERPRKVRLAFESGQELHGVTLTLRLPESVELVGYPGQHELTWQTDLQRGRNELSLPLVVLGGNGGMLVAQLDHGAQRKHFAVRIDVKQPDGAALRPSKNLI